jgi:hypothetical protein
MPGSKVFIADNIFLKDVGGELIRKTDDTNTYKKRELSDGSIYEIIKNYYSEIELEEIFKEYAENLSIYSG